MTGRSGPRSEGLARVATDAGLFTVWAIDHVGSFAQTVSPDQPESMTAHEINAAKQSIIAALGPISRAIDAVLTRGHGVSRSRSPGGYGPDPRY